MNGIIYRLASLISVILFTATLAVSQTAVRPSGSGTAGDPYVVSSLDNLAWIQTAANDTAWGSYYIQTANIDASPTSGWNSGLGFSPIGNSTTPFEGTYDGSGHTISNLFISRSSTNYVGLFGYINTPAVIESLGVTNENITGLEPTGGLSGYNSSSAVSYCYTTGSVNGSGQVGGLIGWNYLASTVSNSYSTASVNGGGEVGGLIGMNTSSSNVRLSYSAGSVSGTTYVGGLVGYNSGSTVDSSFWDIQTSGIDTSAGGGKGDSTSAMKNSTTYTDSGWSPSVWNIGDGVNNGYPYLCWQNPSGTQLLAAIAPDSGDGTSGNPYHIATLDNLYWISQSSSRWNLHYVQTADIDASSDSSWNSGQGFSTIGFDQSYTFSGSYDGQNHTIKGLYINSNAANVGLFGYSTNAKIQNIRLTNCRVTGNGYTGGLVGEGDGTVMAGCSVSGSVGLSGTYYVGGLMGVAGSGTEISKCFTTGTVHGTNVQEAGSLVGYNSGIITNCSSTDSVNVGVYGYFDGGLIGDNADSLSYSYYSGCLTGGTYYGYDVGGVIGYNSGSSVRCFWDKDSSGNTGIGGGTTAGALGETTAAMRTQSTYSDSGWDFSSTWGINGSINSGYPYIQSLTDHSLAVQTTGFIATSAAGSVTLAWRTQSEVNNAGFNIFRNDQSTTNQTPRTTDWQLVSSYTTNDSLVGLGTSSTGRSYDFTDEKVIPGDTYSYKIQSVSTNGLTKGLSTLTVTVDVPKTYALYQNYPNPFNPTTVISYQLSAVSHVTLKIYDVVGREVATLVDGQQNAGVYKVNFNAATYASGVYFYRIAAAGSDGLRFESVEKLMLVK